MTWIILRLYRASIVFIIVFYITSCDINKVVDHDSNLKLNFLDTITLFDSYALLSANFALEVPINLKIKNINKSNSEYEDLIPSVYSVDYSISEPKGKLTKLEANLIDVSRERFHSSVNHNMQEYNINYVPLFDSFPAAKIEIEQGIYHKKRLWLYKEQKNFVLHIYHSIYYEKEGICLRLNGTLQSINKTSYIEEVDRIMTRIIQSVELIDILTFSDMQDRTLLDQFKYYY